MKILVTGGAGLLGSHLSEHLHKEGHVVHIIDDLSTGDKGNIIPELLPNFHKVDLLVEDMTDYWVRDIRPDVIFHLAAWAHEGLSQFCPIKITKNNFNASMNLLVPAIKYGVKRFVFTSSMSVYGDQEAPFYEEMPRKPVDIYGISKAAFEQTLEVMSSVYGFEYCIIRPHNVIGPRQSLSDPYRNVFGIWMNRLLKGLPFYIYGDGNQKRAFSFISDAIPYIALSGFSDKAKNKIFNIGAEKAYSLNEAAEILLRITGKEEFKPIYVPDRPQEVDYAWCSNVAAMEQLGFSDKTSLEDGLKEMWEWAKTKGPQKLKYLEELELQNNLTPKVWTEKKI